MDNKIGSQLDTIVSMLAEFSKGNFLVREEVTEDEDPLNTVVAGLNMLGEELDNFKTELNNQQSFLQNILSSIDEVIYVRNINIDNPPMSPYTFISARSREIIGIDAEDLELNPNKWIASIHPDDQNNASETIKEILRGKEIVFTYRSYHHITQQYRWIEDRVSPKMNAEGQVTHIYGSARDVTEQQKTTLELKDTTKLLTHVITSSDQVFYVVSLEGKSFKNTFTYLSPQVEKVIGYTVDEVRNDYFAWINSIHPDDVEGVKAVTREMFSTKKAVTRIYRMMHRRTGEYVWLEDYVVPILDDEGWIREFYASARDITARKKAELEREGLIMELSKKHEDLMQFNHIVSHNLRSPVASIIGLATFLNGDMEPEELHETTAYILLAANAMDDQLRDLNTILSARSNLSEKMQTFSLRKIIASIYINLKSEISESNTTLDTQIDIEADELTSIKSYIQSAMFNLVNNAIKYRSPDRLPVVTIKVFKKDSQTVISVADNGLGINMQKHGHRLFGLYSRLHTDREGKGLGLYMTKTQIESLNGNLEVDSTEGEGTTFTITLST